MNEPMVPAQQAREHPEPQERARPIPWFMLAAIVVLTAFGAVYIGLSDIESPSSWGDQRTPDELRGGAGGNANAKVDGAGVFAARCAACHQAGGTGLPGVFPPLAGSEWVNGKDSTLAALVLNGVTGTLTVKGQTYNGTMPAFKEQLGDAEFAALLTHIREQWGNSAGPVMQEVVAKARADTTARTAPFNGDVDLAALK